MAGGSFWTVPVDSPGTALQRPTPVGATRGGSWLNDDTIVYPAERPLSHGFDSLVYIGKCGVNDTSNETILAGRIVDCLKDCPALRCVAGTNHLPLLSYELKSISARRKR